MTAFLRLLSVRDVPFLSRISPLPQSRIYLMDLWFTDCTAYLLPSRTCILKSFNIKKKKQKLTNKKIIKIFLCLCNLFIKKLPFFKLFLP